MHVQRTELDGVLILTPEAHADARGFFLETWREVDAAALGVPDAFVQENQSRSGRGSLRGLHFQAPPGQAKRVRVARGEIQDVVVDIRHGSRTYGRYLTTTLDDREHRQIYIPAGFAHGFCVLSAEADVIYSVSRYYDPALEHGIAWDDPDLAIPWAVEEPILSDRDRQHPTLRQLPPDFTQWA